MKLISVAIMTYNHENFISDCLDSVLNQTRLPDEIIVCDDCSNDNNWKIIEKYKEKFGDKLFIIQNEKNLGIFKNCAYTRSLAKGRVIISLAGDDKLEITAVENLYNALIKYDLHNSDEKFVVFTNFKILYPNGRIKIFNNYKYRKKDHISLVIRSLIGFRGFGISRNLLMGRTQDDELYSHYPNLSISLDFIMNIEEALLADSFYFEDFTSNYYRVGYGITSNIENHATEHQEDLYKLALHRFKNYIKSEDIRYLKYKISLARFGKNKTILNLLYFLYFLLINIFNFIDAKNILKNDLKILIPNRMYQKLRLLYWGKKKFLSDKKIGG